VWGSNAYGQLGLGHNQDQNTPQKLNLPSIKKIICGSCHTIVITGEEKVRNAPFSNPLGKMREHFSSMGEEKVRNAPFSNPLGKMREHFSSTGEEKVRNAPF